MLFRQLLLDFFLITKAKEHGFARVHHHVIAKPASSGLELLKLLRAISLFAFWTAEDRLASLKSAYMPCDYIFPGSFFNLESFAACGTMSKSWRKGQNRRSLEEVSRPNAHR